MKGWLSNDTPMTQKNFELTQSLSVAILRPRIVGTMQRMKGWLFKKPATTWKGTLKNLYNPNMSKFRPGTIETYAIRKDMLRHIGIWIITTEKRYFEKSGWWYICRFCGCSKVYKIPCFVVDATQNPKAGNYGKPDFLKLRGIKKSDSTDENANLFPRWILVDPLLLKKCK